MAATDFQILELTKLKRITSKSPSDGEILAALIEVRSRLAQHVHPTNSSFYDAGDLSVIFIFGFWPTVQAHKDFLASDKCSEILAPQEGLLSFQEGHHWRCVGSVIVKGGNRHKGSVDRPMIAEVHSEWIVVLEVHGPLLKDFLESWENIVLVEAGKTKERVGFDKFTGADEGKAGDGMVLTSFDSRNTALLSVDAFKGWAESQLGGNGKPAFEIWTLQNMESGF